MENNQINNETNEKNENIDKVVKNTKTNKQENIENQNKELLISIFKNATTGTSSIVEIMPYVKDAELKQELCRQINGYETIIQTVKKLANNKNITVKQNSWLEKTRLWLSIKLSTLTNKRTRHLAEMLLVGSVMGTIQCYKDLSDFSNCSAQILILLKKLLAMQEDYFNNFKKFL